jgi:hypothetical protein
MGDNNEVIHVNSDHMLQLGIEFGGFKIVGANTNKKRFRQLYGVDSDVASKCFMDLQTKDIGEKRIQKINPYYFLMTIYWIYDYGTETTISGTFHIGAEKTFRKHGWKYLAAIQALAAHNVSLIFAVTLIQFIILDYY